MANCRMNDSPYPSQHQDKFVLRLPDGMRDRIKLAAEVNNRSMNAEIVATLEEKYPAIFTRAAIMKMMQEGLAFSRRREGRRGWPEIMEAANYQFLRWVAHVALKEPDVEGFIAQLGAEVGDRPQVSYAEYNKWQRAMLDRYGMLSDD